MRASNPPSRALPKLAVICMQRGDTFDDGLKTALPVVPVPAGDKALADIPRRVASALMPEPLSCTRNSPASSVISAASGGAIAVRRYLKIAHHKARQRLAGACDVIRIQMQTQLNAGLRWRGGTSPSPPTAAGRQGDIAGYRQLRQRIRGATKSEADRPGGLRDRYTVKLRQRFIQPAGSSSKAGATSVCTFSRRIADCRFVGRIGCKATLADHAASCVRINS